MNSAWLWSRVRLAINKETETFLVTRSPTCSKPDSYFWFVWKDTKSEFVTTSVGIKVRIIFTKKNISQIARKTFATRYLFTEHLNHKTVNKTICRPLSKSSPTIGTLVEKLSNCCDNFFRFSEFPDLSGKFFLILINSPNLITQQYFAWIFVFLLKVLKARKRSCH